MNVLRVVFALVPLGVQIVEMFVGAGKGAFKREAVIAAVLRAIESLLLIAGRSINLPPMLAELIGQAVDAIVEAWNSVGILPRAPSTE